MDFLSDVSYEPNSLGEYLKVDYTDVINIYITLIKF